MIEKLLENWLDRASERSYQPIFVQMLSAQGYRVVHSTRHTALEYGKDILAIAPDGIGCAYQLKGNPGGRLGLAEFRAQIQPQLIQLISQPVVFPGFPQGPHRAYLVSNGFFEEEVQRAVDDLNRGGYRSAIHLLSRGHLLDWGKTLGTTLWPSELPDTRVLLELFLSNPKDVLPKKKLASLIEQVLGLNTEMEGKVKAQEFSRAVSSAALLTGIAIAGFAEAENYVAVTMAWTLFAVSIIGASEKSNLGLADAAAESLALAEGAISDALAALWEEVRRRKYLVESNALADPEVYRWRYTMLLGLLSCLALIHEHRSCLDDATYSELRLWLLHRHEYVDIWGEAAIVSLIPWLVWLQMHEPTIRSDLEVAAIARIIVTRNQAESPNPLPNPFYDFETILRVFLRLNPPRQAERLADEAMAGGAYTAAPLFHLLVRTNLKQHCRSLWPDFSKLSHHQSLPDQIWDYCRLRFMNGVDETRIYPLAGEWAALKREAMTPDGASIPKALASRPWLLALWWFVSPYRYTVESSRVFAQAVNPRWDT